MFSEKSLLSTQINNSLAESSEEIFLESLFGKSVDEVRGTILSLKKKKKRDSLHVFDFDDTLYSRKKTLRGGLKTNRGSDGNTWILAHYNNIIDTDFIGSVTDKIRDEVTKLTRFSTIKGYIQYVKRHYVDCIKYDGTREECATGLISNINKRVVESEARTNMILTAGDPILQSLKLKYTHRDNLDVRVVPSGEDKIKELILYVIGLGYIPSSITIYEDRPEHFFRYQPLLEDTLGTKIYVKHMDINDDNESVQIGGDYIIN